MIWGQVIKQEIKKRGNEEMGEIGGKEMEEGGTGKLSKNCLKKRGKRTRGRDLKKGCVSREGEQKVTEFGVDNTIGDNC